MTDEQIKAIEERHGKATPGPYREVDKGTEDFIYGICLMPVGSFPILLAAGCLPDRAITAGTGIDDFGGKKEDWDFIAASWQDVADLLAEVERLKGDLAAAKGVIRSMCVDGFKGYWHDDDKSEQPWETFRIHVFGEEAGDDMVGEQAAKCILEALEKK